MEQEYVLAYIVRKQKLFSASAFVLQLESEADKSSHTSEVYGGEGRGRIGLFFFSFSASTLVIFKARLL